MNFFTPSAKNSCIRKILAGFIIVTFGFSVTVTPAWAGLLTDLPAPGAMVHLSPQFNPPLLHGVTIDPQNPFHFNFIFGNGDLNLSNEEIKAESKRLIKYFLTALTIPDDDLWVNLSPYEKDRIISEQLGITEMGRDMLAQDYILKQVTASLTYPEDGLGQKFWKEVYEEAYRRFKTTQIPVNTFNKVWILPDTAEIYENEKGAFVTESTLKVMLEEDYIALKKNSLNLTESRKEKIQTEKKEVNELSSQIVREVIVPALEEEVNHGKNFAELRQIYNSLILAKWYKETLRSTLLSKVYVDRRKIIGVDVNDKQTKKKIYDQYLKAFQKGVFNYIKEDVDPATREELPRKYFSGGLVFNVKPDSTGTPEKVRNTIANSPITNVEVDFANASQEANPAKKQGEVPHRGLTGINQRIAEAFQSGQAEDITDQVKERLQRRYDDFLGKFGVILQQLQIDQSHFWGTFVKSSTKIFAVPDVEDNSPAILYRDANNYQVAHVGYGETTRQRTQEFPGPAVYISKRVWDDLSGVDTKKEVRLIDALLLRELIMLSVGLEELSRGRNYDDATKIAEEKAEAFEKMFFKEDGSFNGDDLDKYIEEQILQFSETGLQNSKRFHLDLEAGIRQMGWGGFSIGFGHLISQQDIELIADQVNQSIILRNRKTRKELIIKRNDVQQQAGMLKSGKEVKHEEVPTIKIGNYNYRTDRGDIDLTTEWLGNDAMLDWLGVTPDYMASIPQKVVYGKQATQYRYDIINQAPSRYLQDPLIPEMPSAEAFKSAASYLKTTDYAGLSDEEKLVYLHHLSVLFQSSVVGSDQTPDEIIERRLLATKKLREAAGYETTQAFGGERFGLIEDIMWGAGVLVARAEQKTEVLAVQEPIIDREMLLKDPDVLKDIRETHAYYKSKEMNHNVMEVEGWEWLANDWLQHHALDWLKIHRAYLFISEEDITAVKERIPFKINEDGQFDKMKNIFEKMIKAGIIKPYIIINIKNFSSDTYLAYLEALEKVSEYLNGNITFILSVERPDTLTYDIPAVVTAVRKTYDAFGDDFFMNNHVGMISDGGSKTRGGPVTNANHTQFSLALEIEEIRRNGFFEMGITTFLEANILTMGATWLQMENNYGEHVFLWPASDGIIRYGRNPGFGNKSFADIGKDMRFLAASGDTVHLIPEDDLDELQRYDKEFLTWKELYEEDENQLKIYITQRLNKKIRPEELNEINDEKLRGLIQERLSKEKRTAVTGDEIEAEVSAVKRIQEEVNRSLKTVREKQEQFMGIHGGVVGIIREKFNENKLQDRGNFLSDEDGHIIEFVEKPRFSELMERMLKLAKSSITMNIFFAMGDKQTIRDLFVKSLNKEKNPDTGVPIGLEHHSIFGKIFGGITTNNTKDPRSRQAIEYFEKNGNQLIGINYGDGAVVDDIGNLGLYVKMLRLGIGSNKIRFRDRINEGNVKVPNNVKIIYEVRQGEWKELKELDATERENARFMLKNVKIEAESTGEFSISLAQNSGIFSSILRFSKGGLEELKLTRETVIADSEVAGKLNMPRQNATVIGLRMSTDSEVGTYDTVREPGESLYSNILGPVKEVTAYGDEVITSIFFRDRNGTLRNVIVRAWTADYKAPIGIIVSAIQGGRAPHEVTGYSIDQQRAAFSVFATKHPQLLNVQGLSTWDVLLKKNGGQTTKALIDLEKYNGLAFEEAKGFVAALPQRRQREKVRGAWQFPADQPVRDIFDHKEHPQSGKSVSSPLDNVSTGRASVSPEVSGGIDFNASNLNLRIRRDGNGVPLPLELQDPAVINIEGLTPVIINVTPIHDLPLLLGMEKEPVPQNSQLEVSRL